MYKFKIILLVVFLQMVSFGQFNWQQVNGPTGGSFQFISVNQLSEVFVASKGNSVYFSTNQGSSWIKKNNGLTNFDFTSLLSDTVGTFISTSDFGVFKFNINQNNWNPINTGLSTMDIRSLAADSSGNIYAGGYNGTIFKLNYGSNNWELIFSSDSIINISVFHIDKRNNFYFFSNDRYVQPNGGGLYKSSNGGTSWIKIGPDSICNDVAKVTTDLIGNIYFGYRNKIFRSTDTGISWEKVCDFINSELCTDILSIDGSNIFALMSCPAAWWPERRQNLIFSKDSGQSWEERGLYDFIFYKLAYDQSLNILYCASNKGIFGSLDFGLNWEALNSMMDPVQKFDLKLDPMGTIYISTITGIHRSTNGGQTWQSLFNGLNLMGSISYFDSLLYTFGIDGLFYFDSNIDKWVKLSDLQAYAFTKDKFGNLYLTGGNKTIRSSNNGVSWQTVFQDRLFESITYLQDSIIIAGTNPGSDSRIYRSTNLGNTWSSVHNNGSNGLFCNGDSLIISLGGLDRSEDLGITWENSMLPQGQSFIFYDIIFVKTNEIYVTAYNISFGQNQLLYSTDYGNHWQLISPSHGGFYIDYSASDSTIYIGNNYIIYKSKMVITSIENSDPLILSEYKLCQNFPNPFNPNTTINYSIKELGLVTIKVYDVLGKEVATLVNEEKPSGIYSVQFTMNNLSSGVYYYQLRAGNYVETKKMIFLK